MSGRWAGRQDIPALTALWRQCFGDDEAIAQSFFRVFPAHTYVETREGRPVSMASWMPVTLCGGSWIATGAYLYAVATAPEHRGQGICRRLLDELTEALSGMDFLALSPAESWLYDYYGAMGFETAFYCSRCRMEPQDEPAALIELTPEAYGALRLRQQRFPFCRWDEAALRYLADTGMRFFRLEKTGCAAACTLPGGGLQVAELLCQAPEGAVAALCHTMGAQWAEVRTPGGETPQGMLKWLLNGQKIDRADLGFAFD